MQGLLERALANPWATLEYVLDGPLHPGGEDATAALLDRAGVDDTTRLLDAGCGRGRSVALARERGATAVGIDLDPPVGGVRGDLSALPVRDAAVDVVLAECVMCLVPDRSVAFAEARRVLPAGGRLALSDVVLDGPVPDVPPPIADALCLANSPTREKLVADVEAAGFDVSGVRDHREDLLAMRDRTAARVDYEALLGSLGERGSALLASIEDLEAAAESGRLGYVSLIARAE